MKAKKSKAKTNASLIRSSNNFPVVGVGASAGGLDAFKKLLKAIPENAGMAWVLVQHLSPNKESVLADLLQRVTKIPVLEITDDIRVEPDHIYIIPSNKILQANDGILQVSDRPAQDKHQRNLPIDIFFASLAEVHQSEAIGVVLSGTASDGTAGLKAIKDHGGLTLAQDENSAEYKDMPNNAVKAGVVDFILSPEQIPEKILALTKITKQNNSVEQQAQSQPDVFKQILSLVRIRKGNDFTYYKPSTTQRRIARRMALTKNEKPSDYLKYLREDKTEQDALYQDLLIPVTSFFRDPKTFAHLCEAILKKILKDKATDGPVRIWVAGCSTGQEAYSIAICLKELASEKLAKVQIFATDISEPAIAKARGGIYSKSEVAELSPAQLRDHFIKSNDGYQVNKQLRDYCIFAVHNFLKDPPFGKMDLITCRNVLIYMEPYLQKKALTTFHYALNPKGYLFLGKSETISPAPDLFAHLLKNDKIFSRKDVPGRIAMPVMSLFTENSFRVNEPRSKRENTRADFQKTADDIILGKYTPAGVVVNEMMDIVHFRGITSDYLQQPSGKPIFNLFKQAKNGLVFELRNILLKVKKEAAATGKKNQPVIKENIPLSINGRHYNIALEAMLLPHVAEPHYLILFHRTAVETSIISSNKKKSGGRQNGSDKDLRIQQLERELEQMQVDMRGIADDQEAANEELQSANEELESGGEELRSVNEEMETSKEELQATNEELTVVNQQLFGLNQQLTEERNFVEAIITTIREPLVVLDRNLRVKMANKSFFKTFLVNEKETEGKHIYDLGNRQWDIPDLRNLLERVLPQRENLTAFEVNYKFPTIGYRYMLLNAREMQRGNSDEKLILLAIEDITERKEAAKSIEESEMKFNNLLRESPFAFAILKGEDMVLLMANSAIKEVWGKGADIEGKKLLNILPEIKNQAFPALLQSVYKTGTPHYAHESLAKLVRNGAMEDVYFNFVYQPYREVDGKISGIVIIAHEVTPQALFNKKIKESEEQFRTMADNISQFAWTSDENGLIYWYNKRWYDYTGLSFEESKGDGYKKVHHPDHIERVVKGIQRSLEIGEHWEDTFPLRGKNGEYRWFLSSTEPIRDEAGKIKRWFGTNTDITEQKLAEEQFRQLAELMPEKVSNADAAGNITYYNQSWYTYTGLTFQELKDGGWTKIVHPDEVEEMSKNWIHATQTGEDFEMEHRIRNKTGDYNWHLSHSVAVKDEIGKITKWVGITMLIQTQKEIREKLEKTLNSKTYELLQRNEELLKVNKELESFAYISSHDLQEPLRKIQMFAARITETESLNLSTKGKDYFERMKGSAHRMQILIQDLLSYSRTENTEKKLEKIDLNKVVEEVKDDLNEIILEKNAVIETQINCEATMIPFQFHQMMFNLIGNSLKFSKRETPPHIIIKGESLKARQLQNRNFELADKIIPGKTYCHISVSDNGIGFEQQYSDRIFGVFQRLFSKDEYPGTGIGLSIVKRIVENHNGIITATGEENMGATFDIYIPAS